LNEQVLESLRLALVNIAASKSVRVVVLAARGPAFCAGHDLKEMRQRPQQSYYQELFSRCSKVMQLLQSLPQPVIARVHGLATAAGCQLVAQADLAVAASSATFAVSGINLGLFCATPSVPLTRNIGRKQAFEMLVTGNPISASQACERGLINQVVPIDQLDFAVESLCHSIIEKPFESIAAGKALFYQQQQLGSVAAYQLAGQVMAHNMMFPQTETLISNFLMDRS
jgi:enoyl-CoA hydratase/carnithine racemase